MAVCERGECRGCFRVEERQTVSFLHSVEKFGAAVGGWAKPIGAFGEVFCLSCVWNSWILLLFLLFFRGKRRFFV